MDATTKDPRAQASPFEPFADRLFLKPAEVAKALGIGRSLCYESLRSGEIPGARKIGGALRVSVAVLRAWAENGSPPEVRLVRRVG